MENQICFEICKIQDFDWLVKQVTGHAKNHVYEDEVKSDVA